ncbi:MAG: hypothetical protein IPP31_10565 [Chitinophagaceae bacterium]|nr:hypothetical protein [Chitinophagaceae bacterium]
MSIPAPAAFDTRNRITLALDTLQDPGNMGTLIRLADWFGIRHIVCSTGCADRYNPKVVQSTMGSPDGWNCCILRWRNGCRSTIRSNVTELHWMARI